MGFGRLPVLRTGGCKKSRLGHAMWRGERQEALEAAVEGALHVLGDVLGPESEGGEVDRLQPVAKQRPLQTKNIPGEELVAAGHRE